MPSTGDTCCAEQAVSCCLGTARPPSALLLHHLAPWAVPGQTVQKALGRWSILAHKDSEPHFSL